MKLKSKEVQDFFKYLDRVEEVAEREGYTVQELGYNDNVLTVLIYLRGMVK